MPTSVPDGNMLHCAAQKTLGLQQLFLVLAAACIVPWLSACPGDAGDISESDDANAGSSDQTTGGTTNDADGDASTVNDAGEDASTDADATVTDPDATTAEDSTVPDSSTPSGDQVPVFLATTHGGWTAATCDNGATWVAQDQSTERAGDEHHAFVGFAGSAYANGRFAVGVGWGSEGRHLYTSDNGVDWAEVETPAGVVDYGAMLGYGTGLIAFRGSAGASLVSTDGSDWQIGATTPPGASQIRAGRGFSDGLMVLATTGTSNAVHVSQGDPDNWSTSMVDNDCIERIQVLGGIARIANRIVLASRSALCASSDLGQTWSKVASGRYTTVFEDGEYFYAAQESSMARSADGQNWAPVSGDFSTIDEGHCFGGVCLIVPSAGGGSAYRSTDGQTWTKVGTVPAAGGPILSMTAGLVAKEAVACDSQ